MRESIWSRPDSVRPVPSPQRNLQPAIGSPLAVGGSVGRIIGHFREGFAVKFIQPVDCDFLDGLIIKP